jgi:archaellum component FlaC
MNAVIVREKAMSEADRIAKLEAGVHHLQSDITDIKGTLEWLRRAFETFKIEVSQEFGAIRAEFARELGSFRSEVTKEFGSFRSEVTKEFGSFRSEVTKEFGSFKSEVAKDFGSFKSEVAKDFGSFRSEVAKEFGSVRTSIESLRTAIERAKLWMVVTGLGTILSVWGAALALARFLKP